MLCEICTKIVFRPIPSEGHVVGQCYFTKDDDDSPFNPAPGERYFFYPHYDNKARFRISKERCHLCRKLWDAMHSVVNRTPLFFRSRCTECLTRSAVVLFARIADDFEGTPTFGIDLYLVYDDSIASSTLVIREIPLQHKATFESVEHPEAPRICQNDMLLAQFWMRQCTQEHDLCRQSELARLPLWVIDISNPVKPFIASGNNRHEPYVTLSYTWGSSRRSLLTSHNAAKLQSRLNIDDLPLTFSNAIEAAHELGFAFLWIDALCIRHDVQTELSDQIRRMADIFTGAALTILAGSGENPESGLVMPRDPRVTKPTRVRISVEAEDRKSSETYLIHFLAERRQVMWIEAPPSRRGWVLQEQVLSTRLLSFEKNGLFWRCNSLESDESEPMGWEIHKSTLAGAMCHFRLSLGNPRDLHFEPRITFQHWYFLISHYSRRSLLVLSDVLPALSGIASRFSESFRCNYLAGLWQEDIAVGLLWSTFFNDHERGIPATKMGCPSWSWTSSFPRYVHWPILSSGIMNEEGAQFIKCDISYPYLSGNQFGEVLEAPLTILAHARWTRLKLDQDSPKSMHGTLLADIGSYATGERIPGIQLDSLSGLSSGMPVLCVLCKCTGPSWPALHCIGVLPIAPGSTQYVRLGLVDEMEDSEYFGFSIDHHPDGSGREYVRKYKNYQPKIEIELV